MWPLTGRELVEACGVATWPQAIEALSIGGVAIGDAPPQADELFVALREDGYDSHAHVVEALEAGAALALVAVDWSGRDALAPELHARCLVVEDTLRAYRRLAAHLRRGFSFPVVARDHLTRARLPGARKRRSAEEAHLSRGRGAGTMNAP